MGRRLCFLVGNIYKKWLGVIIPPLIILTAEHDNFIRNNGALEIETKYWLTFKLRNLSSVLWGGQRNNIFKASRKSSYYELWNVPVYICCILMYGSSEKESILSRSSSFLLLIEEVETPYSMLSFVRAKTGRLEARSSSYSVGSDNFDVLITQPRPCRRRKTKFPLLPYLYRYQCYAALLPT